MVGRERLLESRELASAAAKLCALSPRPWRKMTVWVCGAEAGIVKGGSFMIVVPFCGIFYGL